MRSVLLAVLMAGVFAFTGCQATGNKAAKAPGPSAAQVKAPSDSDIDRQVKGQSIKPAGESIYGVYPDYHQAIVAQYLRGVLVDPDSLKELKVSSAIRVMNLKTKVMPFTGYACCVAYNAKDSKGKFVGNRSYLFIIRNNQVIYTETGCKALAEAVK